MPSVRAVQTVDGDQFDDIRQVAVRAPRRSQATCQLDFNQPGQREHRQPFDFDSCTGRIGLWQYDCGVFARLLAADEELHGDARWGVKFSSLLRPGISAT